MRKVAVLVAVLLAAALAAEGALAHGYRGHGGGYRGYGGGYYHGPRYGVSLAFGVGWPYWYYPAPYYYPPQVVVVPSQPQTYIQPENVPPAAAPAPPAYWYFCADAGQYYPYVQECPGGWQRVSPLPPGVR